MAQFVTHIQPTLVEASHHHPPHHHKDTHIKEHYLSKDHHHHTKDYHHHDPNMDHHKDTHGHLAHAREFPVLPHPHVEQSPHNGGHESHDTDYKSKRDSGQYLDSHGVSHTFQLHFVDSQGIYRDCHGHGINIENREHGNEKEKHKKKDHKEHHEEKSPYKNIEDLCKPIPPQFIDLHGGLPDNKSTDGNTSFLRAARNGQLDKVLEHLKSNIDINTSNANGLNALHLASKDGHVEIVEELLKRGAVVDAATKKGNTALHIASLAGQEEVVKLLVNHGASVNVQSQNGFTPLYMAAQENHDNVVKYLLANGANQSLSTEDGFTPLAVAMQQGHDKVVTVLLENDTRGKVRLPALHIAAKKDDVKAAKLLLENEHNPDVTSKSGFTPLHIASHYGNQSIANLLVQKGADVNYAAKHNITPLHVAAKWGKTNMVTVLLEQGANIESKTRDGLTPLHCAARSGHEQVVDMLLEKGAPISSKTKNGLAPLHMAAQGDHVDAARILLYHRAPVDEVTVDYLTALHVAAHCGHVRVAKLLLDRQADANARALNGFTPLHIACKKNRIKVVELLIKHGASIGATTESGLTPLHVASFMGCMNIVIYLLQHDANPDVPTVRGETPLHLAARANQTDIIRILLRNGAQVDARAREQQTPLHIASRLGNVDIVMLLLQHGAKVDNTTKDMYTALHIASKEGQDEVAAALIDNGASLNATTKKGFTPLHLAAKYGHLKVAKLLLQKEAPVDAQGKNGVTPLHVASHYDHQNVALLLLEKGASPYATAKNGHTPLHIAAKKNQMDIANTLLEYGAKPNAESKAGFTPLHLSAQEGHCDMSDLLIEHKADTNHRAKNGLTPLHLCAQEDKVAVAEILVKNGGEVDAATKNGYTPLHIACHYGQINMVRFLLSHGANVKATTSLGYTPLHQAAQQGHTNIVNTLLENSAQPNAVTNNGQTPLHIAEKLGYITVIDTLKVVTEPSSPVTAATIPNIEEKYRVVAPEAMHETFMSDSEEEGGEDTVLGDQTYRYLTADEMKSLGDDSLPIDVTRDERIDSNKIIANAENMLPPRHIEDNISPEHVQQNYVEYIKKYTPDNIDIDKHPINIGKLHWKNFLVSFLVDARGGAMRGCRHSGVRVIVPPRCASSPTRITCRYVRPQRTPHPPPLMEGEALASRVLELGPVGAKFLGPVIIEVPHFAALREKEREIVILRSDNGESWKEHTIEATEDVLSEVLHDSFEAEDLNQLEDMSSGRITRIVTQDFPQYFAVVSRIRQEVHAIGPEGGMVSSTVVPQVQAVFPQGALTKKIKVGLQAQPIDPELTAKLLGHGVAVSPVVTVEPRRRKFHKAITLSMPAPRAHSQGMINDYIGNAPTLRLLCSITGGTTRAQWEDVTGSTPLSFVNDCVSFTTTVSARFWLMDCRNIGDATKMATELYREAIHVPFMAKFVVFAKRVDPLEARLRVFCMTDDKEDKTLEHQEHFTEVAKSRDVEVLEGKPQFIEFAGNLVPITKSGEQLQFSFRAFRENRLPFSVRVKDQHAEAVSRCLFMREPKLPKGEPPQQPICILNIVLPDDIVVDTISLTDTDSLKKQMFANENFDYYRPDPRLADMSNLLGDDWVPLAAQLGLTTSEINVIKSEYPDSVAKQAQSMLRMWLSQSGNKAQANTLESALRRIGREDIIPQCLNVDDPGIKEIGKQRLIKKNISLEQNLYDKDIMKDSESVESLARAEKKEQDRQKDNFDKYSAEEKVVEETSDEEDFTKTVTERRHQIEERLSVDRTVPASSQRVEIVQEISSIKRQSLVENKLAEVEHKAVVDIADETKTTLTSNELTISPPVETKPIVDGDRRDSELLEGVTQRFETTKKTMVKIGSMEDPKSPKLSKTPPPSPADFITKEQAATIQEWDVAKKSAPQKEAPSTQDAEQQGLSTTTERLVASNEEKLLDKPLGQQLTGLSVIDDNLVIDLKIVLEQTNAFIQSESQPEQYDALADKHSKIESINDKKIDDNKNNINEKKKAKKGFFGSIKTFVERSFESDSESEKSPKKSKKPKKEKKKKTKDDMSTSEQSLPPKKPKLPTPPLAPSDLDSIPFVEALISDLPPPYKPPDVPTREDSVAITSLSADLETKQIPEEKTQEKEQEREKIYPKKKLKSKTVVVEEVTKTIEPLVIEAEEFSIIVDPTKKESPKKSKETFTINIDESIEKIEKEILEKSPILPEEKIVKPLAALELQSDVPVRPIRVREHVYEDIEAPDVSTTPSHIKNITTNMIENEINFGGWVDDRHGLSTNEEVEKVSEEIGREEEMQKEIIEKQDKEPLKEKDRKSKVADSEDETKKKDDKKTVFFGLFKKKESKKGEETTVDKKRPLSESVLKDITDSNQFLMDEVQNYHDVRPILEVSTEVTSTGTTTTTTEPLDVEETKTQSDGFFGLFKKPKKEEKLSEKKSEISDKKPRKSDDQTFEKKSQLPEPVTDKQIAVLLSEEVLKVMADSNQFLTHEVHNYHDVKVDKTVLTGKEETVDKTDDLTKLSVKPSTGFFGLFKKPKKDETETPEVAVSEDVLKDIKDTNTFLTEEIQNYHDEKPVLEDKKVVEEFSVIAEPETEPGGFIGLFKKSKKEEDDSVAKQQESETIIQDIAATKQFLNDEVQIYHDVRPINEAAVEEEMVSKTVIESAEQPSSGFFALFKKPKKDEEKGSTDVKIEEEFTTLKVEEEHDAGEDVTSIQDDKIMEETLSPKSSGRFFGLFKKSKKDEEGPVLSQSIISDSKIKDLSDTHQFLSSEVENYCDVKPSKFEAIEVEQVTKIEDGTIESSPKTSRGLFGIFKKPKKEQAEILEAKPVMSEAALKDMNDTNLFLSSEVENYNDVKPSKFEAIEEENSTKIVEETIESSPKTSRGIFGIFKKPKREQEETLEVKPEMSEAALKDMSDTNLFLSNEVENYHDIKPNKFELIEEEKVIKKVEETSESSPKTSRGLFGIFKKPKKEQVEILEAKPVMSEAALKDMSDTILFLSGETENYHDVKPSKFEAIEEEKVTKAEEGTTESAPKTSRGLFGIFKKPKKEHEETLEAKPILSEAALEDMSNTNLFLSSEIENYHDIKPSKFEAIVEEKVTKIVEETVESSPKTSRGLFGIFKKPKKEQGETLEVKPVMSEASLKDMTDTDLFLSSEIENYHDVKPSKFEPIEEEKVTKTAEETVESSLKSSRGLFDVFRKPKKEQEERLEVKSLMSEVVLKDMSDTNLFLSSEVENDHDVKPSKFKAIEEEEITKIVEETVESSPKTSRGLPSIFKKPKEQEESVEAEPVMSEVVLKDISDTHLFLSSEVQNYYDVKPKEEEKVTKLVEEVSERSPKQSRGLFGLFRKSKDLPDVKPVFSETLLKEMDDTTKFLTGEVENYCDVRTEKTLPVTDEKIAKAASEETSESLPKSSRGIFGIFKKPKKEEEEEPVAATRDMLKELAATNQFLVDEIQNYHDVKPLIVEKVIIDEERESLLKPTTEVFDIVKKSKKEEEELSGEKTVISEIVLKDMDTTKQFPTVEIEKDVKPCDKVKATAYIEPQEIQTQPETKTGFLTKFKKTKKKPALSETQLSEEVVKNMAETKCFLSTERDNYEDGKIKISLKEKKEEKTVTFDAVKSQMVLESHLPHPEIAHVVAVTKKESIEPVKEAEEHVKDAVEATTIQVLQETSKLKLTEKPEVKPKKDKGKDKKGFFNLFGKKSKSHETSLDESKPRLEEETEGSPKKQKRRKSSSPFKFFDKMKKNDEEIKEQDVEAAQIVKIEDNLKELGEPKEDLLVIEFEEKSTINLSEEVLSSLDKKIEELKGSYSPEVRKNINDCRDFLFIEVDNYEDAKAIVVTDIDSGLASENREGAIKIIDEGTVTTIVEDSRSQDDNKAKIDLDKTKDYKKAAMIEIVETSSKAVSEVDESIRKSAKKAEKKTGGFFSKLGSLISGGVEDTKGELKEVKKTTSKSIDHTKESIQKIVDSAVEEIEIKTDDVKDKTKTLTEKSKDAIVDDTIVFISDGQQIVDAGICETQSGLQAAKDSLTKGVARKIGDIDNAVDNTAMKIEKTEEELDDALIKETSKRIDDIKQETVVRIHTAKEKIDDGKHAVTKKVEDLKQDTEKIWSDKVGKKIDTVKDVTQTTLDQTTNGAETVKVIVDEAAKEISHTVEKTSKTVVDIVTTKVDDLENITVCSTEAAAKKMDHVRQHSGTIVHKGKEETVTPIEELEKTKDSTITQVTKKVEEVKLETQKVVGATGDILEQMQNVTKEKIDTLQKGLTSVKRDAQETEEKAAHKLTEIKDSSKTTAVQKADDFVQVKDAVVDISAQKIDDFMKSKHKAVDDYAEIKESVKDTTTHKINELKQIISDAAKITASIEDETAHKADGLSKSVTQKITDIKAVKENTLETVVKTKENVIDDFTKAKKTLEDTLTQQSNDLSEITLQQIDSAKDEPAQKIDELVIVEEGAKDVPTQKIKDFSEVTEQKVYDLLKIKDSNDKALDEFNKMKESVVDTTTKKVDLIMKAKERAEETFTDKADDLSKMKESTQEGGVKQFDDVVKEKDKFKSGVVQKTDDLSEEAAQKIDDLKDILNSTKIVDRKVQSMSKATVEEVEQLKNVNETVAEDFAKVKDDLAKIKDIGFEDCEDKATHTIEQKIDDISKRVIEKDQEISDLTGSLTTAESIKSEITQEVEDLFKVAESVAKVDDASKGAVQKMDDVKRLKDEAFDDFNKVEDAIEDVVSQKRDDLGKIKDDTVDVMEQKIDSVSKPTKDLVKDVAELKGADISKMVVEKFDDLVKMEDNTKVAATGKVDELKALKDQISSGIIKIKKGDVVELTKAEDVVKKGSIETTDDLTKIKKSVIETIIKDTQDFVETDKTKTKPTSKFSSTIEEKKFESSIKMAELDEELAKLTSSLEQLSEPKPASDVEKVKSYVTSPTMARRAVSQRLSRDERPIVREVISVQPDEESDEESYTVTEPEEAEKSKRRPLFHLESEEDDSLDSIAKSKERRDSVKSNVLETLTENKLDNLLSSLESQLVKDLEKSVTEGKEKAESKVTKAEVELESIRKDSQADVEQIEQKLRDLDKALDSLEQASDPKLEKKLHRVERKFERMASEIMEKDVAEASPTEVEARREHEFQTLVSQLSTEEVSDFQKEYSHLWDETTFSKSDEWDSKTPDSQVDVQELPQETTCASTLTEEIKSIPQPKPRFAKETQLQFTKDHQPKIEKQISPVRDDLLDDEDDRAAVPETYSDKKKFWENVTKESAGKRMSLHEIGSVDKDIMKKRSSMHELGPVPVPKPRLVQALQTNDETVPRIEEEQEKEKIMSEYQASFQPPSDRKVQSPPKVESDKDSTDSESDNIAHSGANENAGYISDSGDVEHYISDSEIEDRVPQIRERQMSVFAPPVAAVRKTIYERSASLPTEDLYEVSARSIKLRKQYYEEQIKKEMIEEQLTSEIEEEPSPERKALISALVEEKTLTSVKDIARSFDEALKRDVKDFIEITEKKEVSFIDTSQSHKPDKTIYAVEDQAPISTQTQETHKEIDLEAQTKRSSLGSEQSSSSDVDKMTKNGSTSKPDSMEVHVDKSEIEDSEKLAELDQDATDLETKSLDSLNAVEISPKSSYFIDETIPEITVTLSGKQRRISEESDEYVPKPEKKPTELDSPIHVPEEHVEDTVWEVSVQSQPEARFDEKVTSFDAATVEKIEKDDDLSLSTRDESDLGSEIHQDHSDSYASDKIKSESHSDIERIILDSLHQQKVDPAEAKAIASTLIEEIEAEIQRRECLTTSSTITGDVSDYLKYLAETKGLDEREVELVESVLARRQRELAKLSRGDTQASSIEITDEDLKYSGSELDTSHLLEQQISQLKAEKVDDMKSMTFLDKIDEKRIEESHFTKDYETCEDNFVTGYKSDLHTKAFESIKAEKSENKDTIFEEDETISESATHESEQLENRVEAIATEVSHKKSDESMIDEYRISNIDVIKKKSTDISAKTVHIDAEDLSKVRTEDVVFESDVTKSTIKHQIDLAEKKQDEETMLKGEIICDDLLSKEEKIKKETTSEIKQFEGGVKVEKEEAIEETHTKTLRKEVVDKEIQETHTHKDLDNRTKQSIISSKITSVDVVHESSTSSEIKEKIETIDVDASLLPEDLGEVKTIIEKHEEIKRTSSSESKSSIESGKSPDDQFSTCSSGRKGDSDTSKIVEKQEVLMRKASSHQKVDRKSGIDFETYSSSGESHYHSFELDSGKSRPCSSDVEGLVAAGSSEYESALTSQDYSTRSHVTSTEYHTAVSSLSSKESMKSLDSESSGHLGSVEVSELSETLVPSASDLEGDILDAVDQLEDGGWNEDQVLDEPSDKQSKMKRSYEMTFQPEPKILASESPQADELDRKFTSMDDGSIVSMSLSSTSGTTEPRTVIELSRADSERIEGGSMSVSGISDQLSIEGSCDSLVFHPTTLSTTVDMSTSTGHTDSNLQIESITITTSTVNDSGIRSVSTQVTSESHTPEEDRVPKTEINGKLPTEIKKKCHRRQESTSSFVPSSMLTGFHSELTESDKYAAELSFKEVISDEKKDIDEREKEESYETEADQGFHRDIREGKYQETEDEIKDDTPEFSSETQASIGELEQEYTSALARTQESKKKSDTSPDLYIHKEALEKRDSHGKSSSTSSEKSSFEEAEAEAAFNMVAHVSPAHKIKQICPILEDEDAEKHELETRERAQKEYEKRRSQIRDQSPGSIPDIKVTQHMTPLVDRNFHYPDLELEQQEKQREKEKESETQKSTPQTPSSKSSEDTDQGREYILEDSGISIPEEPTTESRSTVIEQTVKEETDKDTDSPNSDSFEMLEKPDLIDDFVVIEEVAKEAQEFDSEGKSVCIKGKSGKRSKKHDEEVEAYLTRSAPTPLTKMTDVKFYPDGSSSEELGFDFEDSPPVNNEASASSYDKELEANKKWIEQQFQGDHAARMAAGYDYEMEFERGPLEDIKEEDINDFDPTSSRIGSLGSQKESGGSLGSVKDSYSSTPEYDVLAGRKYFTKSGEHDDISMSSLQEFENLERAMSLETKRYHQGSQDSSSNGSFKTRYYANKCGQGDDVSVSSLKEFEGLEMACIAAHKIEVKAKEEEAMLAQIDEGQESLASESESCETISRTDKKLIPDSDEEDYEKRMFEIDEIIRQAQSNVERFIDLKEGDKTESLGRGDSIEEVSKVPDLDLDLPIVRSSIKVQWKESEDVMITSTDSIDGKVEKGSHHDSTDSLDQKTGADIMTASTDSIEFQLKKTEPINLLSDSIEIKDEVCGMISSDSLELAAKQSETMLESTDSLADPTSSTATHATYQYETDSVFSGSFTSGGSNTMVSSTDTIDPVQVDIAAAARKVWFDEDSGTSRRFTTEYVQDTGKPYVTEVIEPSEDDSYSHTIHRRVELPPEVRKVTFYGSDADERLRQFIEDFGEGEHVEEVEEVDSSGNIHTKRIVQKRFIVRGEEGPEMEEFLKKTVASKTNQLTKETTGEQSSSETMQDAKLKVEGEESASGSQHAETSQQRSITDQHQLSEEMKELLKELEKESKQ